MSSNLCEFCNKTFSSKSSLYNHKRTAIFCLSIQNANTNKSFKCGFCDKQYTSKNSLEKHMLSCKDLKYKQSLELIQKDHEQQFYNNKLENFQHSKQIIEDLKKDHRQRLEQVKQEHEQQLSQVKQEYEAKISELQNKLFGLCSKAIEKPSTTITNNNNISQHFDIDNEAYFKRQIFYKFDENYIDNGVGGVADFICDNIIKNNEGKLLYTCTDTARQMFKYIDKDGNTVKDPKASKLISRLQPPLIEKSGEFCNFCYRESECEQDKDQKEKLLLFRDKMAEIGVELFTIHKNSKLSSELSKRIS